MSLVRSNETRRTRSKFAPQLETLEDRTVPTITGVAFNNGVLSIFCQDLPNPALNNDVIRITEVRGSGNPLRIEGFTNGTQTFNQTFSNISQLNLNTFGGADQVTYTLGYDIIDPNDQIRWARDVIVNLGEGNDTWTLNLNGQIDGSRNSRFIANGQGGNDTLNTTMTRARRGGLLGLSYDGGVGNDTINIGLSGVNIGTNAGIWMNLWGSDNQDNITVTYQGDLDGRLLLHAEGNGGNDNITVNFNLNSGSTGRVGDGGSPSSDFQMEWNRLDRVTGGLGRDTLIFIVTAPSSAQVHAAAVTEGLNLGQDLIEPIRTPNVQLLKDTTGGWAPGLGS